MKTCSLGVFRQCSDPNTHSEHRTLNTCFPNTEQCSELTLFFCIFSRGAARLPPPPSLPGMVSGGGSHPPEPPRSPRSPKRCVLLHPWLLIRNFPQRARVWMHFLKSPGSIFRVWHFLIWGDPDAGLSSGALRAPELKTTSRTPARSARRLDGKIFWDFCKDFFEFWVSNFGHFLIISGDFRG